MMSDEQKKRCFVIMSFDEKRLPVYLNAIKPACEQAGYEPIRVDELEGIFNINQKIIEHIFTSDAVIADLTDWRPNVFYEMGVAHAIDNKTIMIIQRKDKVPFDVSTYSCIYYDQTEMGFEKLIKRLVSLLNGMESWRNAPTNPVQQFKPFDALIPKGELEKFRRNLAEKEKQLQNAVTKAEFDKIQKELQLARSRLSEMLPKTREAEFKKELSAKEKEIASLRQQLEKLQTRTVPKEKISGIKLRSEPLEKLSEEEVKKMLVERGFFDSSWNKKGKGFPNGFETLPDGQVVYDRASGLMWQQSGSPNYMAYQDAKKYIAQLNRDGFAGYSDWRMPTLEEAMSLMEPEKSSNGLYIDPLFDKTQEWIWTADQPSASRSWRVGFNLGGCNHGAVGYGSYGYVRAVRFGQSSR